MLHCRKCKFVKPDDHFYASNQSKCKECVKKSVRDNRRRNVEYYREFDRQRANDPKRVKAREEYAQTEAGKISARAAKAKWTDRNPVKRQASVMVGNAVRDGRLEKSDYCEECGNENKRIHGHHDDYSKPLEVRWLCPPCHNEWHKLNGEAANG